MLAVAMSLSPLFMLAFPIALVVGTFALLVMAYFFDWLFERFERRNPRTMIGLRAYAPAVTFAAVSVLAAIGLHVRAEHRADYCAAHRIRHYQECLPRAEPED